MNEDIKFKLENKLFDSFNEVLDAIDFLDHLKDLYKYRAIDVLLQELELEEDCPDLFWSSPYGEDTLRGYDLEISEEKFNQLKIKCEDAEIDYDFTLKLK